MHPLTPNTCNAFTVSGEYFMIKAGAVLKMIDEEKVMICLRRAVADVILFVLQQVDVYVVRGEKCTERKTYSKYPELYLNVGVISKLRLKQDFLKLLLHGLFILFGS
ncbi:hypothetical protein NE237_006213 [Protea cynaroides]|uniref:porphobilinogen synthase n=1 Tax=Protea cynaroides TaxID=273540 RepID=A0A9Q0KM61_9MAGN|nr:hypothetical protein NE237_006213 [Protea cynaroides]